ncbi:MAG: hypothetical protein HY393_01350 [Candidatus Diapherotrites archaeon]|nr:hypothetical protein [Candidatus Diapherotrites archaeon]
MKTVTLSKQESVKKRPFEQDEAYQEIMKGLEDIKYGRLILWKPKTKTK